jgi:hypothetical protein
MWLLLLQFSADGRSIVFLYRIGKCPRFYGAYFRTCATLPGSLCTEKLRHAMLRSSSDAVSTCPPVCSLRTCLCLDCCQPPGMPPRGASCHEIVTPVLSRYVFTIDVTGQHLWRVPVVEGAYHDFGSNGRLLVADKVGVRILPALLLLST